MTEAQSQFLRNLENLIQDTQHGPRFKGQTKAVRALKRIQNLSDFN